MSNNRDVKQGEDNKPKPLACAICGKPLPCSHKTGGGEEDSAKDEKITSSSEDKNSIENIQPTQHERGLAIETVGLVTIYHDDKNGKLIILGKKELSKDDKETLANSLSAIKAEFDEFKNSLEHRGIGVDKFNVTIKGDKLTIHIPSREQYDEFIQQLHRKNLLPEQHAKLREKKSELVDSSVGNTQKKEEKPFNPSPFSMKLERK